MLRAGKEFCSVRRMSLARKRVTHAESESVGAGHAIFSAAEFYRHLLSLRSNLKLIYLQERLMECAPYVEMHLPPTTSTARPCGCSGEGLSQERHSIFPRVGASSTQFGRPGVMMDCF